MSYDIVTFPKSHFTILKCNNFMDNKYKSFKKVKSDNINITYLGTNNIIGGSFWSETVRHYKGIVMAIKGVRSNLKPSVRKIIEENKNSVINHIEIGRTPLGTQYKTIMNFTNTIFKHSPPPFDKLFHLYMICHMSDGKILRLQKNEDVDIINYESDDLEEKYNINQNINIGLQAFINNAKNYMGEHDFNTYNATSTNCQHFVLNTLKGNGINITPELNKFIMQDVKNIVPNSAKKILLFMTSLKNRVNTVLSGEGTKY